MKRKTKTWQRVQWPYSNEKPYCDWECWKYGNVILHPGQWPREGWSYVAAFGANSDRSHSGFLKGYITLDSAKTEIEERYSRGAF